MTQLDLFPDLELVPTPAMVDGRSHLFGCWVCGSLLCVPSSSTRSTLVRQVMRELGACSRCGDADWHVVELDTGPFKALACNPVSGLKVPATTPSDDTQGSDA